LGYLGRVAGGDGVDSMRFWLERGGDEMKRCRRMKRMQRAHLSFMERKRDMVHRCGDIDRRRGSTKKGNERS
jgi:hypothetical protein